MNVQSASWILMAWCFSTRSSVATVLTAHPCVSRCLRVKLGHFQHIFPVWYLEVAWWLLVGFFYSSVIWLWISNCNFYPCIHFNGSLANTLLKSEHGLIITKHRKHMHSIITYNALISVAIEIPWSDLTDYIQQSVELAKRGLLSTYNLNPNMKKSVRPLKSIVWNCLSILLKFGKWFVISSHTLLCLWLLVHAGIKVNSCY